MRYAIPVPVLVLTIAAWMGEQWLSQTLSQTFATLPWGWFLLAVSAFLCGVVYAEVLNENSALRARLKNFGQIVEVENFALAHKSEDEKKWYEAIIHTRFLKSHRKVACTIQITQYAGINHAEKTFVIMQENISNVEANLYKKFVVARFPRRISKLHPGNPYWGKDSTKTWAGNGNHIVKLKLRTILRKQTENFLISAIKDVGDGPEPVILFGAPRHNKYIQIL